ncbi:MAG: hypothetical protein IJ764_02005 [Bacteroidales bacterium]|nr:hypothetical protein [Bacteroidales bacterium]
MKYIKSGLLMVVALLPLSLKAQSDSSTYNESVIIRGKFNPVITRSEKINVAPAISDSASAMDYHFTYQPEPARLSSFFAPSRFKPVRVVGEPRTRLYHNYIRIGFGNYWSPLFDFYYNSTTSRNLNYGVRLNHRSSWGKIGDENKPEEYFGPAYNSLTEFNAFGKYIIKEKMQLYGDLTFQNDYNLYYGFCDTTLLNYGKQRENIETAEYKAPYNYVAGNVGIKNVIPSARIGYEANLHLSDLIGAYGMNEFNLDLDGMGSYRFQLSRDKELLAAMRLSLDVYAQNASDSLHALGHVSESNPAWQPDSLFTDFASRLIFRLNPFAEITLAGIRIHAGARIAFDHYADRDATETYVYPDVTISRNFMNNALGIVLGASGNAEAISRNNIRLTNPYTLPYSHVNSYRYYDFFGNIRYTISKRLELDVHASYNIYDNRLSFRLSDDYLLGNVFAPKYESGNLLTVGGDFSFVNDEMIAIGVGGNYYYRTSADTDTLPILYSYPFDIHLNTSINYHDKFLFHLQFMLIGKSDANYEYDMANQEFIITEELPLRYGLNLEFEYRHNKALSAFLKVDNLLFQRYYYWQNYPSQRALFTIGATYTIPTK